MKRSKKFQLSIVLFFPIINAIASTTQGYFNGIGSGDARMILISIFIFFTFHKFYRPTLINNVIIINLLYLFIVALFATDLIYTFKIYSKYLVSTIMFSIGYFYIKDIESYKKIIKIYMIALFIMTLSVVISNIFHLGRSDYLESTIYFGINGVNITKSMSIILLISPLAFLFLETKKSKISLIFLVLLSLVFVLLGIKRTAILSLILGYNLYLYLSSSSLKLITRYISLIFVLILLSPLYLDTFYARFSAREESGRFDINRAGSEESRFIEVSNVINDFYNGDIGHQLFGSELFNYMEFSGSIRMLHTDYATIFSGSGIIGLFLFLLIYIVIFQKVYFYRKIFIKDKLVKSITAVCLILILTLLIYGGAGTVHSIGTRALIFLFLGASLGFISNQYITLKKEKKKR